jgi:hypothetical protein
VNLISGRDNVVSVFFASTSIVVLRETCCRQQPGGETPGVAVAPVALAGAIMPGLARSMVMFSLQAAEFGVGMAAEFGSMLVSPSAATAG